MATPADPTAEPDNTAVRTALWRALHVEVDSPPHVLEDCIGLALTGPPQGWRARPDMDVQSTRANRAGIVARARFVEDLVEDLLAKQDLDQLVLLGAGLDTVAQRRLDLAARIRIFEIDRPGTQEWKRHRLTRLGLQPPIMVAVDFETGSWWDELAAAGFDRSRPAVVSSSGVAMYLTEEANIATLRTLANLAPGSTVAMTFQPRPAPAGRGRRFRLLPPPPGVAGNDGSARTRVGGAGAGAPAAGPTRSEAGRSHRAG